MYAENLRYFVEYSMRQLKGFVPRGERVEFKIVLDVDTEQTLTFTVPQTYGAEDQLQPETEFWTP